MEGAMATQTPGPRGTTVRAVLSGTCRMPGVPCAMWLSYGPIQLCNVQ